MRLLGWEKPGDKPWRKRRWDNIVAREGDEKWENDLIWTRKHTNG